LVIWFRSTSTDCLVQVDIDRLIEIQRLYDQAAVGARTQGNPGGAVNGHRQHKTIVIVGVFANEIDAAWCADDDSGWCAELSLKGVNDALLERHTIILDFEMVTS